MELSTWLAFFAASWAISISPGFAPRVPGALKSPSHIRAMNPMFGGLFVVAGSLVAMFKRAG